MPVRLDSDVLSRFRRVSCYNSPYPAHRDGRAVDLYPGRDWIPSPVAGTIRSCARFSSPAGERTVAEDVLLVVDTGEYDARMLHVEPAVSRGDEVAVGDRLGQAFRSGYFDPWVPTHVHLEFRPRGSDSRRARGGLPIALDVEPIGVDWDGRGTVIEVGPQYAVLDRPRHPAPGDAFAGIASEAGGVIDGGIPHYGVAGIHGEAMGTPALLGVEIGTGERDAVGRPLLAWGDRRVEANGSLIGGLSCLLAFDGAFGARLIDPPPLSIGDDVRIRVCGPDDDNAQ